MRKLIVLLIIIVLMSCDNAKKEIEPKKQGLGDLENVVSKQNDVTHFVSKGYEIVVSGN